MNDPHRVFRMLNEIDGDRGMSPEERWKHEGMRTMNDWKGGVQMDGPQKILKPMHPKPLTLWQRLMERKVRIVVLLLALTWIAFGIYAIWRDGHKWGWW